MKNKKRGNEKAFFIGASIVVIIFAVFCALPIILVISASLTDEKALVAEGYQFLPSKFSLASYAYLWRQRAMIGKAYLISVIVTFIGTSIGVLATSMCAYPLSRSTFRWRNLFTFLIFFTMLFNGGVVSSYMVWTQIFHIKNTIWALIFPNYLVGAFNIILVKNYYQNNIPVSLVEAAKLDGATEGQIFQKVMLPLSKPVIVTITMFSGLAYWNDWTNGLYYINKKELFSVQLMLNEIQQNVMLLRTANDRLGATAVNAADIPSNGVRMAIAIIALLPIMIIFPLIQKELIKGVVIGAVKG
ncbi:putative aldouronate transport system permease protein [Lachnospiraceae bacterium NK3A20]|nr:putative aldouronate transport system permease protein [Lachnospiraceae bacterium NK3A20]